MRNLALLIVVAMMAACGNSTKEGAGSDVVDTANNTGGECTTWLERARELREPAIAFNGRCYTGEFRYLSEGEEPGCWADVVSAQFYQDGVRVATAQDGYSVGPVYSLYDAQDRLIMQATHRLVGDTEDPFFAHYWKYDASGRLRDLRSDEFVRIVSAGFSFNDQIIEDGVILDHGYPSYFDYQEFIDEKVLLPDPDGLWEGCEHNVYRGSEDSTDLPAAQDVVNDGRCSINVHHFRTDGQRTFRGTYSATLEDWWSEESYEYSEGLLARKELHIRGLNEEDYISVTTYEYDEHRRLIREDEDAGLIGQGGGDGLSDKGMTYTWHSDTQVLETSWFDDQAGERQVFKYLIEYDGLGRKILEDSEFDYMDRPTRRVKQSYDIEGRRVGYSQFETEFVDGERVFIDLPHSYDEWEYDGQDRLVRERSVRHDPAGLPALSVFADDFEDSERVYTYDTDGKLVEERWTHTGYPLFTRTVYKHVCD